MLPVQRTIFVIWRQVNATVTIKSKAQNAIHVWIIIGDFRLASLAIATVSLTLVTRQPASVSTVETIHTATIVKSMSNL